MSEYIPYISFLCFLSPHWAVRVYSKEPISHMHITMSK